jgi:hypothetical protein
MMRMRSGGGRQEKMCLPRHIRAPTFGYLPARGAID